jgi:DNA-directed RNA polymerase subunit omega
VSGTAAAPEGITNPPIDDLLEAADGSKYGLVIYAAKRARQINAYYSQLGEGLLEYVGPLVETHVQEKPLSVALREIDAGLLTVTPVSPEEAVQTSVDPVSVDDEPGFDTTPAAAHDDGDDPESKGF